MIMLDDICLYQTVDKLLFGLCLLSVCLYIYKDVWLKFISVYFLFIGW